MIDREKAINCLTDIENIMIARQEICPREELQYWIELQEGVADALALLKEQEAVKPYVTGRGDSFETAETWWYACGNCHEALDPDDKYCRHCGREVLWHD